MARREVTLLVVRDESFACHSCLICLCVPSFFFFFCFLGTINEAQKQALSARLVCWGKGAFLAKDADATTWLVVTVFYAGNELFLRQHRTYIVNTVREIVSALWFCL